MAENSVQNNYNNALIALNFSGGNTEFMEQPYSLSNYRNGDADFWGAMVVWTIIGFWVLFTLAYLLFSWSIWKISKKLSVDHSWMSWVPVFQYYQFIKVCGKVWYWLFVPIIVYFIVKVITLMVVGYIISPLLRGGGLSMIRIVASSTLLIEYIAISIAIYPLNLSLSKRLGRGAGTALLSSFFPLIMYPYLATRQDTGVSATTPNASASTLNFGSIGVTPLVTSDTSSGNATPSSPSDVSSVSTSTSETSATSTDTSSGSTDGGSTTH